MMVNIIITVYNLSVHISNNNFYRVQQKVSPKVFFDIFLAMASNFIMKFYRFIHAS